jgi:hypothetical protein
MLLPSEEAVHSVLDWLQSAGVEDIEEDADWVNFRTTVGTANSLLDTKFQWYRDIQTGVRRLRTLQYSVPSDIENHVDLIEPTTRFGQVRPHHHHSEPHEPGNANAFELQKAASAAVAFDPADCVSSTIPGQLYCCY